MGTKKPAFGETIKREMTQTQQDAIDKMGDRVEAHDLTANASEIVVKRINTPLTADVNARIDEIAIREQRSKMFVIKRALRKGLDLD